MSTGCTTSWSSGCPADPHERGPRRLRPAQLPGVGRGSGGGRRRLGDLDAGRPPGRPGLRHQRLDRITGRGRPAGSDAPDDPARLLLPPGACSTATPPRPAPTCRPSSTTAASTTGRRSASCRASTPATCRARRRPTPARSPSSPTASPGPCSSPSKPPIASAAEPSRPSSARLTGVGASYVGEMFWLRWKMFRGSYRRLTSTSRAQLERYAHRMRSASSAERSFT